MRRRFSELSNCSNPSASSSGFPGQLPSPGQAAIGSLEGFDRQCRAIFHYHRLADLKPSDLFGEAPPESLREVLKRCERALATFLETAAAREQASR